MGSLIVGIAEMKIASQPDIIITMGLGSCVAITLFDPLLNLGGLVHIMLPSERIHSSAPANPYKYADSGIEGLLKSILERGAIRRRLQAKLAGGSEMFPGQGSKGGFMVGKRNILASRAVLGSLRIPILCEDTGGNFGRTVEFDTATGLLKIKTIGHGDKLI